MSVRFFLVVFSLFISGSVVAADTKIGFVNAAKLMDAIPQSEKALQALEKEFSPKDREIRQLRASLREMEADLDKNGLVMSKADAEKKQQEITTSRRKIKRLQQEYREDLNLRRNEELAKLERVVTEAIIEVAESEGYDLIVQQAIFASKSINITEKVLKKLSE